MPRIELKEAIQSLRTELAESTLAGADESIRFELGQIALEFQVGVERSAGGSGGLKFWVIEIAGEETQSFAETHTVKILLKPVKADGGPVLTGGETTPE